MFDKRKIDRIHGLNVEIWRMHSFNVQLLAACNSLLDLFVDKLQESSHKVLGGSRKFDIALM